MRLKISSPPSGINLSMLDSTLNLVEHGLTTYKERYSQALLHFFDLKRQAGSVLNLVDNANIPQRPDTLYFSVLCVTSAGGMKISVCKEPVAGDEADVLHGIKAALRAGG